MLLPDADKSQDRWPTYLVPISEEVQIDGALFDNLVLKEIHKLPEGGKYNPLVLSFEGVYLVYDELLEQLVPSNTHKSLAHIFLVLVLLYFNVNKFILANET